MCVLNGTIVRLTDTVLSYGKWTSPWQHATCYCLNNHSYVVTGEQLSLQTVYIPATLQQLNPKFSAFVQEVCSTKDIHLPDGLPTKKEKGMTPEVHVHEEHLLHAYHLRCVVRTSCMTWCIAHACQVKCVCLMKCALVCRKCLGFSLISRNMTIG